VLSLGKDSIDRPEIFRNVLPTMDAVIMRSKKMEQCNQRRCVDDLHAGIVLLQTRGHATTTCAIKSI
jgi:hypothetical protein